MFHNFLLYHFVFSAFMSSNTPLMMTIVITVTTVMDDFRTFLNFLLYHIVFVSLMNLKIIHSLTHIITVSTVMHHSFYMGVGDRLR